MSLHDRRVEHLGQHDEVTLGARGSVEDHPLVAVVGVAHQPARQPISKAASGGKWLLTEWRTGDVEQRPRRPCLWIRSGFENGSAARDAPLMDSRAEGVIDLLDQHLAEGIGSFRWQPALLEVLGQPSKASGEALSHRLWTLPASPLQVTGARTRDLHRSHCASARRSSTERERDPRRSRS